uniref:Tyrosine specific protein phosphatases domain-containing protein n=1 Tax=Phytophthora ramorum TaxID=164328 RepID=H3GJU5_PHYRM
MEPPLRLETTQPEGSRLSLPAGTSIFFRALDCARWSRELLHGTLVDREPVTSNGDTFYHRVLWLRGVEALPNGFFRAALALPGWDITSDNDDDIGETFWPHEIGVFPTQLGALRAVVTAEQTGRAKFRRELAGGRMHRWREFELDNSYGEHTPEDGEVGQEQEAFPSSEILDEIVAETAATLSSEFGVRLTRQDDARFHQELARGTWNFREWMATIGRTANLREEDAVPYEDGVLLGDFGMSMWIDIAREKASRTVSVFVCLMEPEELKSMEAAAGGSGTDTDWSYESQIRTKYGALCRELKGAQTISKRHVELAQQLLVDFDAEAGNATAAAMGGSGAKNSKKRRSSMTSQQQQEEDAAEEASMIEAREALEHKLQLAEQQATKASRELARLGMMQIEFLYFPIAHDGVPDSDELMAFLEEQVELRLREGKNLYLFSRLGHGRTGLVSALLLGRVYGITASEALERAQRTHDCQRPEAPRGLSFCSPTTAPQIAFVRRVLARSMDPIYVPLVLENSAEGFRSTRVQQRGLLAEAYLREEGFMIGAAGDAQAREREALEQKRLERIARRESTAAALQRERRKQKNEHETMEVEESAQAACEAMTSIYTKIVKDTSSTLDGGS